MHEGYAGIDDQLDASVNFRNDFFPAAQAI